MPPIEEEEEEEEDCCLGGIRPLPSHTVHSFIGRSVTDVGAVGRPMLLLL